jgi:hypothetical protein
VGACVVDKFFISTDQMVSATDAAKKFKFLRKKAKQEPQYILDRSTIDSVLINFEHFQKILKRIQELEEENLLLTVSNRLEEYEKDPSIGIPWEEIYKEK